MGAALGVISPIDASTKRQLENAIKDCIGTFTKEYLKSYAIHLVKKIKADAQSEPEDWKLEDRPENTADRKSGWVIKEGGIVKKQMNKRFFIIRHDHMIDYWATEEDQKAGKKPRGTISLCGYSVNPDANDTLINRLKKLAEMMGMNFDDLPKPKEYPKGTMEIHHPRRPAYYIQIENDEERKAWLEAFQNCCRFAYGLKNKDPVHVKAFHHAINRTRWRIGAYGYWSYGGTEEQIISDLVADYIDWKILCKVWNKLKGPWIIREKVRNKVIQVLDKVILAGVTPAWKVMSTGVEALRPKVEEKLKTGLDPLFKLQGEISDKIQNACMSVIDPILKEHVTPHLSKIVACIKSPMVEGFDITYNLYDEEVLKWEFKGGKEDAKKEFHKLDHLPHSYHMWKAYDRLDSMYDPLWALNTVFPDIYPWHLIWKGRDILREKMDAAVYTFEKRLEEKLEEEAKDPRALIDSVRKQVLEDFHADGKKATVIYYRHILKHIVMPPFKNKVFPACETLLKPINDNIPDTFADILDLDGMFEDILTGIIDKSIDNVLGGTD